MEYIVFYAHRPICLEGEGGEGLCHQFFHEIKYRDKRTVSFSQASELVPWLVAQIEGLLRNF